MNNGLQVIENVKPEMSVANGTMGKFHSLVLPGPGEAGCSANELARLEQRLSNAAPGTIVHLPFPPRYLTMRIPKENQDKVKWPALYDLLPGCEEYAVIPIDLVTQSSEKTAYMMAPVPDFGLNIPSGMVCPKPFRVTAAFSLTVPKSQGLTLHRTVRISFSETFI